MILCILSLDQHEFADSDTTNFLFWKGAKLLKCPLWEVVLQNGLLLGLALIKFIISKLINKNQIFWFFIWIWISPQTHSFVILFLSLQQLLLLQCLLLQRFLLLLFLLCSSSSHPPPLVHLLLGFWIWKLKSSHRFRRNVENRLNPWQNLSFQT